MAGNYSNTGSWVPNVYSPGLRNVGSYQVSGTPHITVLNMTSSTSINSQSDNPIHVQFPYVTSRVVVFYASSQSRSLRVGFQSASAGNVLSKHHYMKITGRHSYLDMNVKCKEIYVFSDTDPVPSTFWVTVYAELTNIPTSSMFHLTGSGITE